MFSKKEEKKASESEVKQTGEQAKERVISEEEYRALKKKAEEFDAAREGMLRTAADYENAKKRFAREKDEFLRFANERLIREFLPVLDNLDRAANHARTHKDSRESILEGVEIIRKQLFEMLKSHGLERQDVIGKQFDPHQHEALGHVEDSQNPEDTIVDEIEGGYLYQGRLLRPAKVRIAKPSKSVTRKSDEEKDEDLT